MFNASVVHDGQFWAHLDSGIFNLIKQAEFSMKADLSTHGAGKVERKGVFLTQAHCAD